MSESNLPAKIEITKDKLKLIKDTIAKDATDDELALFKYICEKRQLDPFARQIYALKRRVWNTKRNDYDEVMTFQTGIDGFRIIAERSRKYAGQLGPFFTEDGSTWLDCWVKSTPPKAAKVAVLRRDFNEPIWAMARFDAYCPRNNKDEPTGQWRTMPDGQIAKCAEALALRRAFPEELSGIYASEEMHQTIDVTATAPGELRPEETPRARSLTPHELTLMRDAALNPLTTEDEGKQRDEADGEGPALESGSGTTTEDTQTSAPHGEYPTAEEVRQAFVNSPLPPAQKFDRIDKAVSDFKRKGYAKLSGPERQKVMEALQR